MQKTRCFSLEEKNILITGASSGIGRQCAIACSEMGATVSILGRNQDRLQETLASMQETDRHLNYSIDLLDYNGIEAIVRDVVEKKGKINGLINCAGISTTLPFKLVNTDKLENFFHTNVYSAINLTKNVVKPKNFSKEGGSVIFICSVMGAVGEVGKSLYGMTKGALLAASKSLSLEFAPKKIRVNCISPGVVITPMSQKSVYSKDEETLNRIKSYHPLGLGEVEDVASACVFLLSDEAKWITGINLPVDGGYMAR